MKKTIKTIPSHEKPKTNRGPAPDTSTLLMLAAMSGGRCEFEGCNRVLFRDGITLNEFNDTNVAHIVASSPNGPRGDAQRSYKLSNKIENLMLVCLEHHKMIDNKKLVSQYPEERLLEMKYRHEQAMEILGDALNHDPSRMLIFTSSIKGRQSVTIRKDHILPAMLKTHRPAKSEPDYINVDCEYDYTHEDFWRYADNLIVKRCRETVDNIVQLDHRTHFSVFPIAPIPFIIKLGYLMGDKIGAEVYQKRRHPDSWEWQTKSSGTKFEVVRHLFDVQENGVAVVMSLSAAKSTDEIERFARTVTSRLVYELHATKPNVDCISTKDDLSNFWHEYLSLMDQIRSAHPDVKEIPLLPAVPVSAAFEIGRRFMQGVYPNLIVYDVAGDFVKTLFIGA